MIILVSPTKQMEFNRPIPNCSTTTPQFRKEAMSLNSRLAEYDTEGIRKLMSVSSTLAQKTAADINRFSTSDTPVRPAIFTYSGTVFGALDPYSLTESEMKWARQHLRILSGLYGYVRPTDGISPYRLEMKCPLPLDGGESLASFWKPRIGASLDGSDSAEQRPILNLASAEYSKVLDRKALSHRIINFSFKDQDGSVGKLRTVGMYAKVARGLMLRRILREQPGNPEGLQKGSTGGYRFSQDHSSGQDWVFVRRDATGQMPQ